MANIRPKKSPPLAVLFWFYRDADICKNHLELFRQTNPETPIYGLYGGSADQADHFANKLASYLDDFYLSPFTDMKYKWRHGDQMITDWFRQRGRQLDWRSLFILQWDALIFTNLDDYFCDRQPDELYFSGHQQLTPRWERGWHWTKSENQPEHELYHAFQQHVRQRYPDIKDDVWHMCMFVFEIFTRDFLEQYSEIDNAELGFLEYKIPTYAHIWGYSVYKRKLGLYSDFLIEDIAKRPINTLSTEIDDGFIRRNLKNVDGWRLFHPFFREWNLDKD